MNTDDAQRFVKKMQEDIDFRREVTDLSEPAELWDFLKHSGFEFGPCDLVKAMAACMAELENTTENGND